MLIIRIIITVCNSNNIITVIIIINTQKLSFSLRTDIDECSDGTHKCNQHCRNTQGSYLCECSDGYYLSANKRTCLGRCSSCRSFKNKMKTFQHITVCTRVQATNERLVLILERGHVRSADKALDLNVRGGAFKSNLSQTVDYDVLPLHLRSEYVQIIYA